MFSPDLPEQGRSKGLKPFSIKDSARRIIELIKSRAHEGRAHVVGHSIGAQIAVQVLSVSPEVVGRAIVTSALVRRIPGIACLIKPSVKLMMPLTKAEWFIKMQAKALSVPDDDFANYYNDSMSITAEALENILRENINFGLPEGLEYCTVPTLILVGQKERRVMRNSAKDLVSAIPNSQGYLVQGVGHNFSFEDPNLYNNVLRAWLTNKQLSTERLKVL